MKKLIWVSLLSVLVGCAGTPKYTGVPEVVEDVVNSSAHACIDIYRGHSTPANQQRCRVYFDLLVFQKYYDKLVERLLPHPGITPPMGCPLDGPNCPMFVGYRDMLFNAIAPIAGDPSPQPNIEQRTFATKPLLPYKALSAKVQLNRIIQIRDSFKSYVSDLEEQISILKKAGTTKR